MGLKLKEGVLLEKGGVTVSPQILLALQIAEGVWRDNGVRDLVVTSLLDGVHSPKSLHYQGKAVDIRTKGMSASAVRLHSMLRAALPTNQFDVILEGLNEAGEHIHLEFQLH